MTLNPFPAHGLMWRKDGYLINLYRLNGEDLPRLMIKRLPVERANGRLPSSWFREGTRQNISPSHLPGAGPLQEDGAPPKSNQKKEATT